MNRFLAIPFVFACCIGLLLAGCEAKKTGPLRTIKEQSVEKSITSVRVNWIAGDVKILKSADHAIHIEQSATTDLPENNRFTSSDENGVLTITDNNKINFGLFSSVSTDLTLSCPDQLFDSLSVSCTSGSISGENLQAKSLEAAATSADIAVGGKFETMNLKSASGKITGKDLKAKSLSAKSTSGDISVSGALDAVSISSTSGKISGENLQTKSLDAGSTAGSMNIRGSFETLNLKSVSGKMDVFCSQMPKTITSASTAGNINLDLPQNDGFSLAFHSTSGKLNSDFALQQNDEKRIYKNGSSKITVHTTSGSLTLRQEAES